MFEIWNLNQLDVRGNSFGLLAAHPVRPLVTLHHLEHLYPIFPNKSTITALDHLFRAVEIDSQRILQQTVCYDRWFSWTISVSWGYAVQVFDRNNLLPEVISAERTFRQWQKGNGTERAYTFNTREPHPDLCKRPTIFFLDSLSPGRDPITSTYKKSPDNCTYVSNDSNSPRKLEQVRVFSKKMDLNIKQVLCCSYNLITLGDSCGYYLFI